METDFFRRLIDLHNSHDYPLSRAAVFLTNAVRLRVFRKIDFPIKAPPFRAAIALKRSPGKYTTSELSFRKRGCYLPFESSDENSPFCKNIKREKERERAKERRRKERTNLPLMVSDICEDDGTIRASPHTSTRFLIPHRHFCSFFLPSTSCSRWQSNVSREFIFLGH